MKKDFGCSMQDKVKSGLFSTLQLSSVLSKYCCCIFVLPRCCIEKLRISSGYRQKLRRLITYVKSTISVSPPSCFILARPYRDPMVLSDISNSSTFIDEL